jgi:cupin fold WbuC family metalloprotein
MSGHTDFSAALLDYLVGCAERSPRRRVHHNVHASYDEPVQRLFNAICEDSYIRPHRHLLDPKQELLISVRGRFGLLLFDDEGSVTGASIIGAAGCASPAAEIMPAQWHTVLALEPRSVLLEIKAGPFDPSRAKELAPWSPEEGAAEAAIYHARLRAALPLS